MYRFVFYVPIGPWTYCRNIHHDLAVKFPIGALQGYDEELVVLAKPINPFSLPEYHGGHSLVKYAFNPFQACPNLWMPRDFMIMIW